ncbi:hypothetical protein [Paludisphaera sp.]|uniref:hypothetical protein n=1 Tax=Paludisphaera sp. TaxID=2017432 RepID=UPI00301C2508
MRHWADWIPSDHRNDDPHAVPIYGARPYSRADLRPVRLVEPKRAPGARDSVLRRPWEPAPREHRRHGEMGAPAETPRACPHNGPILMGSVIYCEECAKYGRDYDKRLVRDPRTDPKREPAQPIEDDPEPTRAEDRSDGGRKTSGKMARRRARKRAAMTGEAA